MSSINLIIASTAFGGKGIARHEGKVYFVPGTVPGDEVRVRITKDTARYAEATLVEVLQPSPLRGPAPCPHAASCGGCQWQGISGAQQDIWKRSFVHSALERIGRLQPLQEIEYHPAPSSFGYRSRIVVQCRDTVAGGLEIGFFAEGSHLLVPISQCLLADSILQNTLKALPTLKLSGKLGSFKLDIMSATSIEHQESGSLITALFAPGSNTAAVNELLAALARLPGVLWSGTNLAAQKAPFYCWDQQFGLKYLTRPGQFQQVNRAANQELRRIIRAEVAQRQPQRILDLHCGSGNLSLALAQEGREILGIEANPHAIAAAQAAVAGAQLVGIRYKTGDAAAATRQVLHNGQGFDLVIADPPRDGMRDVVAPLLELGPGTILYVSCDPTTFARDLGALTKSKYNLTKVLSFDFFPNTYHVESLAILEKS